MEAATAVVIAVLLWAPASSASRSAATQVAADKCVALGETSTHENRAWLYDELYSVTNNPFLWKDNETIPFDKMRPSMIISAACKLAQHLHAGLDQLESETTATWRKVIEPLELLHDSFDRVTSVFELLARVNQTLEQTAAVGQGMELNAWKEHSNEQLQALDNFLIKMNEGAVQLASNSTTLASFNRLDEEEIELKRKFVDNVHQGTAAFRLTLRDGEHLRGVPHSTLAAMAAAAQKHDMRYSTGSPGAIHPPISAPPLNGAAPTPEWGPWTVTFDPFVYESMMAYCPTRRLRQILFQSYENRASQEPWNNMPVVERLLLVRHDKARLYDLASYADLVGIRRMASPLKASDFLDEIKTPVTLAAVRTLLPIVQLMADSEARGEDVWGDAYVGPESLIDSGGRLTIGRDGEIVLQRRRKEAPYASNETSFTRPMATESPPKIDLRALHWVGIVLKNYTFAPTDCKGLLETVTAQLRPWDVAYWQRRLAFSKQSLVQHGVAPDEIRNYFTLSRVLSGAFGLLHRLWGIHVVEGVRDKPPVWHPDVRHFQLFNGTNLLGSFFFDPFARPNKLSIPFTQTLAKRSKEPSPIGVRTPIVVVSTYIQNPEPGEPALLQIENVRNVFHELGHAIQILANQNSEVLITGTTTLPLDLTEMFGQFYELWATEDYTLSTMAQNYKTRAMLSPDQRKELVKSERQMRSIKLLEQLYLAKIDLSLHSVYSANATHTVLTHCKEIAKGTLLVPSSTNSCDFCALVDFFGSRHGAGYYSYLWSSAYAADAMEYFKEVGILSDTQVRALGDKMAAGLLVDGTKDGAKNRYKKFRGRLVSTEFPVAKLQA